EPGPAELAEQWKLAAVSAVKVIVTKPGWYRVKKSDLAAAGFDPGSNANAISVFTDGVEVPVLVNAKSQGKFDSADTIEFLGRAIDTQSTGGRVYYITAKKGSGARVKSTGGRGNSGSPAPQAYPFTFERIERYIFFASLVANGDRENFFGPILTMAPTTQALTVNNAGSGNAEIEVGIQGGTENIQHVVSAKINGTNVGTIQLFNQERKVQKLTFAASLLTAGENTLTLTSENGWEDVSVLESVRLTYPHTYRADSDALTFTVDAGTKVSVAGFTNNAIKVLD